MARFDNPPYYITAYGLAVKRGYMGTLDQWLESLRGDRVELRMNGRMIQWRWLPRDPLIRLGAEDGWTDLMDTAALDGHTPERGVDYWTDEDKAEIVEQVLDALPAWTGGDY